MGVRGIEVAFSHPVSVFEGLLAKGNHCGTGIGVAHRCCLFVAGFGGVVAMCCICARKESRRSTLFPPAFMRMEFAFVWFLVSGIYSP